MAALKKAFLALTDLGRGFTQNVTTKLYDVLISGDSANLITFGSDNGLYLSAPTAAGSNKWTGRQTFGAGFESDSASLITANAALPAASIAGTNLVTAGADGANNWLEIDSFGGSAGLNFRRADGTNAAKTAVASGDTLGQVNVLGYSGAAYTTGAGAQLGFWAAEAWSATSQGTYATIGTAKKGTTGAVERLRVTDAGNLALNNAGGTPGLNSGTTALPFLDLNTTTTAQLSYASNFVTATAPTFQSQTSGVNNIVSIDAFGGVPVLDLRSSGGTAANRTATQSGAVLGVIGFTGNIGGAVTTTAAIRAVAAGTFGATYDYTYLSFHTFQQTGAGLPERMRINYNGYTFISTQNNVDTLVAPIAPLEVNNGAHNTIAPRYSSAVTLKTNSGTGTGNSWEMDAFAAQGVLLMTRYDGNQASKSALASSEDIGSIQWAGATSASALSGIAAQITATSWGAWSTTANGTMLRFLTSPYVGGALAERMRLSSLGCLGLSTNNNNTTGLKNDPAVAFDLNDNVVATNGYTALPGASIQLTGRDNYYPGIVIDAFAGYGISIVRKATGTAAAKTALTAGSIHQQQFQGWDGSAYGTAILIDAQASAFSTTDHSGYYAIQTVTTGTTALAERLRVHTNGYVGIANQAPTYPLHVSGVIGASGVITTADITAGGKLNAVTDLTIGGNSVFGATTTFTPAFTLSGNSTDATANVVSAYYRKNGKRLFVEVSFSLTYTNAPTTVNFLLPGSGSARTNQVIPGMNMTTATPGLINVPFLASGTTAALPAPLLGASQDVYVITGEIEIS